MEAKWPFMLITFGLIFALGLTIANMERTSVMNNWSNRRCELPVAMAAMFFKPDNNPQSKGDFAKDNFNFCMKTYVDNFMNLFTAPINALFGQQTNIAGSALGMVSTIRTIAQTLFNTLLSYLDTYFQKFNASVYEMSRIVQYLRMAIRRANAMVISMLYSGITLFRGMLNTIQFVIKVILIICGIMLAIIIILFFILFPVIPMIIAVLGAIITTVLSLSMVMGGDIANEASSDKHGFCLSEDCKISIIDNSGKALLISVKDLKIGDELGSNCGKVTAVIHMDGKDVLLYNIHGVHVSGSHLVLGTDKIWKSVESDERARCTNNTSKVLYCFNTTTHQLPVYANEIDKIILFKDWEEIDDDDISGKYVWNYTVLKTLNNNSNYNKWATLNDYYSDISLVGKNKLIKVKSGFVEISKLLLFEKVLDRYGNEQPILGVITAEVKDIDDNGIWNTGLYELNDGVWIKGQCTTKNGRTAAYGMTLITESGEFIIWDEIEKKEKIVRDFTDIGYDKIHQTYPMVASRLRQKSS